MLGYEPYWKSKTGIMLIVCQQASELVSTNAYSLYIKV